jgi:hypothetical protein
LARSFRQHRTSLKENPAKSDRDGDKRELAYRDQLLYRAVQNRTTLGSQAFEVLVALIAHAGIWDGRTFVSQQRIADELGWGRGSRRGKAKTMDKRGNPNNFGARSVDNAMRELRNKGWLVTFERSYRTGKITRQLLMPPLSYRLPQDEEPGLWDAVAGADSSTDPKGDHSAPGADSSTDPKGDHSAPGADSSTDPKGDHSAPGARPIRARHSDHSAPGADITAVGTTSLTTAGETAADFLGAANAAADEARFQSLRALGIEEPNLSRIAARSEVDARMIAAVVEGVRRCKPRHRAGWAVSMFENPERIRSEWFDRRPLHPDAARKIEEERRSGRQRQLAQKSQAEADAARANREMDLVKSLTDQQLQELKDKCVAAQPSEELRRIWRTRTPADLRSGRGATLRQAICELWEQLGSPRL